MEPIEGMHEHSGFGTLSGGTEATGEEVGTTKYRT